MTTKVFWSDPYLTKIETIVSAVSGDDICLESTIFFAFSGGQESDTGTIGGYPVLNAKKQGLEIIYTLSAEHDLAVGDTVTVQIDWDRRYGLMRHHFAAEMILQLVYEFEPGIEKVGAHISPTKARIDFSRTGNIGELFERIRVEVDALIAADKPIVTAFSDEENHRRYWEVEGFARMGCGGTHPRTIGEIGLVQLKRKNQGKGVERIEITLAELAKIAPQANQEG